MFFRTDTDPEAMKAMNAELVAAFRAARGELDGACAGVPLLLMTTTGARSGKPTKTPVNYTRTAAGYVVVASKSGSSRHPDWYQNLLAHPDAMIEVRGKPLHVRARITNGEERIRLFDQYAAARPNLTVYQARTTPPRAVPDAVYRGCRLAPGSRSCAG